jgi:hypothetical protein
MGADGPGGLQLCVWVQDVVAELRSSSKLSGTSGWEKSNWQGKSGPSSIVTENVPRTISPLLWSMDKLQGREMPRKKRERKMKESRNWFCEGAV